MQFFVCLCHFTIKGYTITNALNTFKNFAISHILYDIIKVKVKNVIFWEVLRREKLRKDQKKSNNPFCFQVVTSVLLISKHLKMCWVKTNHISCNDICVRKKNVKNLLIYIKFNKTFNVLYSNLLMSCFF